MKARFTAGLSHLPVILLGVYSGWVGGWLAGRAFYFLSVEWPNRHLSPERFFANTCGLNLLFGMLTYLILIPIGIIAGVAFGIRIWRSL